MKNTIKLFAAFLLVGFFIASCGGDECQTCTMEGVDDKEFCEEDFDSDTLFTAQITAAEALGYDCK